MQLRTISATSYKTYDTCPYQWKLKYKLKCLQMPNPAFVVGTAFHKGAELFHKGRTLEHILTILKDEMLNEENTTDDELEMYGLVRQMVEAYVRNPVMYETVKIEFKFTVPIFGVSAPLFGFVDRIVDGGVVEYKTSAKDYTIDDIDNIQTDIYSYAYNHFYKKLPRVTYCILNKKKSKRQDYKPQVLEITRTEDHMKQLVENVKRFEQDVKSEMFEPKPGIHCKWCPYSDCCEYKRYGK